MRFVLVHGGWQGGWCWDQVAARLRAMLSQPGPLAEALLEVCR